VLPVAWRIINDSLRTDVSLLYPPHQVAPQITHHWPGLKAVYMGDLAARNFKRDSDLLIILISLDYSFLK